MSTSKHASLQNWQRIFTIILLVGLLWPIDSVSAQDSSPYEKKFSPTSLKPSASTGVTNDLFSTSGNLLQDPSFEQTFYYGYPWSYYSATYPTPL